MRFGNNYQDDKANDTSSSGFMKYFKDGDTTFRVIQPSNEWVSYWEHFNPNGFPFPCTGDKKTCPGCTSKNEKMNRASKKVAIQVLEGEYVNVYKFPKTVAEKLENRENRLGTITDRDYTISRYKNGDRTDYDIESGDRTPIDIEALRDQWNDVEQMLQDAYDEAWGDSAKAANTQMAAEDAQMDAQFRQRVGHTEEPPFDRKGDVSRETPPAEDEYDYTEDELRSMDVAEIRNISMKEIGEYPPEALDTTDAIVDWLLEQ